MELEESGIDNYEVFLSFRGPDTRQGFTDVLYDHMTRAGIRVFRDDDELDIGDKIDKILLAIKNSQICVPIFSKTFAQSKWCLKEVREMVELNKVIAPIFYDVTPDDVKLRKPAYIEFMRKHSENEPSEVRDWVDALNAIAKIKGREVKQNGYADFCKSFVVEVLNKLKPTKRYNIDPLVGIDDQLESAMKLLDIGSDGVRYISIHGMGGIGKTTLAKIIFNKLSTRFEYSSFLESIREYSSRIDGIENLRRKLNDSFDPKSATRSSSSRDRDISEKFYGKRVLIILDDVDKMERIKEIIGKSSWLGSGSRIIATARSNHVLNEYATLYGEIVHPLEMRQLDDDEALQLFSRYAFGKASPPADFSDLSKEVTSLAGGLPLALIVIGSRLCTDKKDVWKDLIARLKKIPAKEVKEQLKLSFDALEHEQQQIFLDLACFFVGTEKSNPCYMWESCELHPTYGLAVLESMCLVKITENNVIWMHDQLRDLGRDIVREESIRHPTRRSRLWEDKEALKVLMSRESGKQMVEALSLRKPLDSAVLADEHLASFENLRFLELAGGYFVGNSKDLLENLTWLSWHLTSAKFNLTNFCLENLVILDLSQSLIDENWGGWSQLQMANNMKVLDLRSCHNLTRTPCFAEMCSLERLIMSHCSQLATIGSSIGNLVSLQSLDLRECNSLHGFPEELGSLSDLREILLSGSYTDISFSLPNSIGKLKSLVSLRLSGKAGLNIMPDSLVDLESLVELDLSYAGLSELPDSIGRLVKLKELNLQGCTYLKELPDSLCHLSSLVRLDLSEIRVSNLPASIGDLQELQVLTISRCKITALPASIVRLKKLVELNAASCYLLEEFPQEIEELSGLRRLNLSGSPIRELPSTIGRLFLLEELNLEMCEHIENLPKLPPGLTKLSVPSHCSKQVHDQSKLDIISSLRITNVDDLEAIQRFPGKLKKLDWLLSETTTLPFDLSSLTQLETLHLSNQPPYTSLPCLSGLKNLLFLEISDYMGVDGLESLGVRELENLRTVRIVYCSSRLIQLCLAKNLRTLSIIHCSSFRTLPDLSHLKALTHLNVLDCKSLTQILGMEELESLSSLIVGSCRSMKRIGNLSKLKNLSKLHIYSCPELTWIEGIDGLFIKDLSIKDCKKWDTRSPEPGNSMLPKTKDSTLPESSHTAVRFSPSFRRLMGALSEKKGSSK